MEKDRRTKTWKINQKPAIRTVIICCYLCDKTFDDKISLSHHFWNVHKISQAFGHGSNEVPKTEPMKIVSRSNNPTKTKDVEQLTVLTKSLTVPTMYASGSTHSSIPRLTNVFQSPTTDIKASSQSQPPQHEANPKTIADRKVTAPTIPLTGPITWVQRSVNTPQPGTINMMTTSRSQQSLSKQSAFNKLMPSLVPYVTLPHKLIRKVKDKEQASVSVTPLTISKTLTPSHSTHSSVPDSTVCFIYPSTDIGVTSQIKVEDQYETIELKSISEIKLEPQSAATDIKPTPPCTSQSTHSLVICSINNSGTIIDEIAIGEQPVSTNILPTSKIKVEEQPTTADTISTPPLTVRKTYVSEAIQSWVPRFFNSPQPEATNIIQTSQPLRLQQSGYYNMSMTNPNSMPRVVTLPHEPIPIVTHHYLPRPLNFRQGSNCHRLLYHPYNGASQQSSYLLKPNHLTNYQPYRPPRPAYFDSRNVQLKTSRKKAHKLIEYIPNETPPHQPIPRPDLSNQTYRAGLPHSHPSTSK